MGHTAFDCYNQMNYAFQGKQPPAKLATMASSSYHPTQNYWLSNTGTTDHFTHDLPNLQQPSKYRGGFLVLVGNGKTLTVTHIGNSQLQASKHIFHLRHILKVPGMKSNLLSVRKCCEDNHCNFYFDESLFSRQDLRSGKIHY